MRYFRATPAIYGEICVSMDIAYGYPNADTKTERAMPLVEHLPSSGGKVYLTVTEEFCNHPAPAAMLPDLLQGGYVEEITAEQYQAALPQGEP